MYPTIPSKDDHDAVSYELHGLLPSFKLSDSISEGLMQEKILFPLIVGHHSKMKFMFTFY